MAPADAHSMDPGKPPNRPLRIHIILPETGIEKGAADIRQRGME
jgi:hypothetical protein